MDTDMYVHAEGFTFHEFENIYIPWFIGNYRNMLRLDLLRMVFTIYKYSIPIVENCGVKY